MQRNRGFTLIELMIVIAIIALILSVGIPQYNDLVMNGRLSTQTNELQGLLQLARSEAATNRVQTLVCGSTDQANCNTNNWEQGVIAFRNRDGNNVAAADELIRVIPATTNGITIRGANGSLRYLTDGTMTGVQIVRICDNRGVNNSRQIFINTSGQSRTHQGNYDDNDADTVADDGVCP